MPLAPPAVRMDQRRGQDYATAAARSRTRGFPHGWKPRLPYAL